MVESAILALADGSVFNGTSVGYAGYTVGEVVFNTSMTGYQEILSDLSYTEQIVTLTQPHIGNVGVNSADLESVGAAAKGLIIRSMSPITSSWRQEQSLAEYLQAQQIVAIADIDTRALTRLLRTKGSLAGCIKTIVGSKPTLAESQAAIDSARGFAGIKGLDLAQRVTTEDVYTWTEPTWQLEPVDTKPSALHKVVVYDYGVKLNILRLLVDAGCEVTVVPARMSAADVLAMKPDGVLLSNGPGDPEPCDYAIEAIQTLLNAGIPLFGICLGHQLLALACGAKTEKMLNGHHGANHPVLDLRTGEVAITSQNHGFCVSETDLPSELEITHRSLFDQTIQGLRHRSKPAFCFQGHPEASPGPQELISLFQEFTQAMSTT